MKRGRTGTAGAVALLLVAATAAADPYRLVPVGPMVTPRSAHVATRLRDGRVLITGGQATVAQLPIRDTEIFDPATRAFTPGPPMTLPRAEHAAMLMPDGRVLLAGGATMSYVVPTASAEMMDPDQGSVRIGDMIVPRSAWPFMTLSPDGSAWIFGGAFEGRFGEVTDLVERLPPGRTAWMPAGRLELPCAGHWVTLEPGLVMRMSGGNERAASSALKAPCRRWAEEWDLRGRAPTVRLLNMGDWAPSGSSAAAAALDSAHVVADRDGGTWLLQLGETPWQDRLAELEVNGAPDIAAWGPDAVVRTQYELRILHPVSRAPSEILPWTPRQGCTLTVLSPDELLICGGSSPDGEARRRAPMGALLLVREPLGTSVPPSGR